MVLCEWGSFWRFVLVTTGIGAVSGLSLLMFNVAPPDPLEMLRGLGYAPFFIVPGAVLGFLIGGPAYGVLRLCLRTLPGRKTALAFFFLLGIISALAGFVLFVIVVGGPEAYTFDSPSDVVNTILGPALTAGILAAAASLRIVAPAEKRQMSRQDLGQRPTGGGK